MGGAASRFGETDWDAADGGLKSDLECIDGSRPTAAHSIITMTKGNIVNQREFDIRDDQDLSLYSTKAVEGTVKWFDVFGAGGQKLLRVETDATRRRWDIFCFGSPAFPGQRPDPEATAKAGEPLYKKARVDVAWDSHHATVSRYGKDEGPAADGTGDGTGNGTGVISGDPMLKVEEIKSITAQYQTYIPQTFIPHKNEPLVGFWVWEHTPQTHRIKMHLAKGTDMALHIALAVMTNMVYTERMGRNS